MSTPHIWVHITLDPGEARTIELDLAPGPYRLRTLEAGPVAEVELGQDPFPAVVVRDGQVIAGEPSPAGNILLRNEGPHRRTLVVEDRRWVADALTADWVATFQAFRDLCSTEVLRAGDEVAIGRVTLLFSDLRGSTALYEAVGDAAAYHLVRGHFAYLAAIVREHDGAVMKTIGDAVMAAFHDPLQALRAALAMQDRVRSFNEAATAPIVLKLGLHEGPCIAVTLNDRLDYFGQAVNLAARLQGESRGGDIVLSLPLARLDGAADVMGDRLRREETAVLRGVAEPVGFVRLLARRPCRPGAAMRVAMFSTKPYDRRSFEARKAASGHEIHFWSLGWGRDGAAGRGFPAVCLFVNDVCDAATLELLAAGGTRLVALRCAGFNNVDLAAAARLGIPVVRVPAYSPYAVAEFTVGLILTLNRQIHRAYNRTREDNFALDGLMGFDLHGKTVGVIGTGKIGGLVARSLRLGFGCEVLAHDRAARPGACRASACPTCPRTSSPRARTSITLHCPLTPETRHIVNARSIARMKRGVMLVNTSRGALVDVEAVIDGLKSGQIGYLAIDVYEQEADLFFQDLSSEIIQDDAFQRLLTFPNVLVTGHQAFFTREAWPGSSTRHWRTSPHSNGASPWQTRWGRSW